MGKLLRPFRSVGALPGRPLGLLAMIVALALTCESAFACRGYVYWSRGDDLTKLKPNEIVVSALHLATYKIGDNYPAIMGSSYGFIYYVRIAGVAGGSGWTEAQQENLRGIETYIYQRPSVCEQYVPHNFDNGVVKTLVLAKGVTGLYELVGGQN